MQWQGGCWGSVLPPRVRHCSANGVGALSSTRALVQRCQTGGSDTRPSRRLGGWGRKRRRRLDGGTLVARPRWLKSHAPVQLAVGAAGRVRLAAEVEILML